MKSSYSQKGFTLVEMLIVIAIIAILASVALVSVRGVRSSANDTKRISDLNKVQQQLEVYYTKNGSYPATPANWAALGTALGSTLSNDNDINSGRTYEYAADAGGQHYTLKAQLENTNKILSDPNELDGTSNGIACDDAVDANHWNYCIGN
jgi:prepilin-type N-terminal cleavage/methylation domain-containing protein